LASQLCWTAFVQASGDAGFCNKAMGPRRFSQYSYGFSDQRSSIGASPLWLERQAVHHARLRMGDRSSILEKVPLIDSQSRQTDGPRSPRRVGGQAACLKLIRAFLNARVMEKRNWSAQAWKENSGKEGRFRHCWLSKPRARRTRPRAGSAVGHRLCSLWRTTVNIYVRSDTRGVSVVMESILALHYPKSSSSR